MPGFASWLTPRNRGKIPSQQTVADTVVPALYRETKAQVMRVNEGSLLSGSHMRLETGCIADMD